MSSSLEEYISNADPIVWSKEYQDDSPEGKIRYTRYVITSGLEFFHTTSFLKCILDPRYPDGIDFKPMIKMTSEYSSIPVSDWVPKTQKSASSIILNADSFMRLLGMYPKLSGDIIPGLIKNVNVERESQPDLESGDFQTVKMKNPSYVTHLDEYANAGVLRLSLTNVSQIESNYWFSLRYVPEEADKKHQGSTRFTLQTLQDLYKCRGDFQKLITQVTKEVAALEEKKW